MKVRTQLILAFLLLAVVPLSGLTLYSYWTSVNAFKKAAEAEAVEFSSELERRFQRITRVINEEVENVVRLHYDELLSGESDQFSPETERAISRFHQDINSLAPYIRSLEIAVPGEAEGESLSGTGGQAPSGGRGPSSMILSFSDLGAEAEAGRQKAEALAGSGSNGYRSGAEKPFFLRARPENNLSTENGEGPLSGMAAPPDRENPREFIRELVFNRLSENRSPSWGNGNGTGNEKGIPELYVSPLEPARPESSYITRNRELNFDSPLYFGDDMGGLLKANINGPVLMREVMQATMREGDIPFVLDREGVVITTNENHLALLNRISLEAGTYTKVDETAGEYMISARQVPRSGRTIGILRPLSGELQAIKKTALINSSFGVAACILALLAIYPLSKSFTLQLGELMNGVRSLSMGNLDIRVPVTTKNEFGRLAESFNRMAVDLKLNQDEKLKHEGLKRELELCREIQQSLLPGSPLKINRAELQGVSIPAREVGGDFFNYFALPGNRTALLIGDVSGKGVPAALMMANIQAKLQAKLPLGNSLARMAEELDDDIFNSTLPENYLTLFAGILDYEGELLKWVNAGHNTQYLLRRDGRLEQLRSTGRPLGLLPGGGFAEEETRLREGDTLLLFTDGLADAENEEGEFFGEERLEQIFAQQAGRSVNEILIAVEKAIRDHNGKTLATDDATMLVLKIAGPETGDPVRPVTS